MAGLRLLAIWTMLLAYAPLALMHDPCDQGCDLEHKPVCGADGFTYQARCFAECQGIEVVSELPCNADEEAVFDGSSANGGGSSGSSGGNPKAAQTKAGASVPRITAAAMNKYKAEGFRLVGRGRASRAFKPKQPIVYTDPETGAPLNPPPQEAAGSPRGAVRYDFSTSLMYASDEYDAPQPAARAVGGGAGAKASAERVAAGRAGGLPQGGSGRQLRYIFGADDRRKVNAVTDLPWRAVGLLSDHEPGARFESLCTGALISQDDVLTAGHCVYLDGEWSNYLVFCPGCSGYQQPYGTIPFDSVTTYRCWTNAGRVSCDMAVVKLSKSMPADHGTFSLEPSDTFEDELLNTAGYPGDKPYGTMWYTSCTVTDNDAFDGVTYNGCDIYEGQSGSPAWAYFEDKQERVIRGVVSHSTCIACNRRSQTCCLSGTQANVFLQMTSDHVDDAMKWVQK